MNIKHVLLLFALFLILIGCEDYLLNKDDPGTISDTEFWKSKEDYNSALIATYQALQYDAVSSGMLNTKDRIRTDMSRSFDFYNNNYSYTTFRWSVTDPYPGDRWKALYVGVFRANQVLDNIKNVQPTNEFSSIEINNIKAQARFLRALFYFWIVNSFDGAIIFKHVPKNPEEIKTTFSDYMTVVNEVVIPDLKYAELILPRQKEELSAGRATWGAAAGILGKVYLYVNYFDSASIQFKKIIDSDIYKLSISIRENFTTNGEHNSESIFEINFSDVLYPGVHAESREYLPTGDRPGQATSKATNAAPEARGGLRLVVPTFWATELFLRDSIDATIVMNQDKRYSERATWSIAFIGQDGDYYRKSTTDAADWYIGGAECAYWKKGTNWATKEDEDSWNNTKRSGINERILRYADVKLMHAEALLRKENSSSTDVQEALQHVDDIRRRAGVITLQKYMEMSGGKIPVLYKRGPTPHTSFWELMTSISLLKHIQMVERPLELTFEGNSIRWHDLRRWGLIEYALRLVDEVDYTQPWLIKWLDGNSIQYPDSSTTGLRLINAINLYQNHQLQNYTPELHNFFPIPIDELNTNRSISE